MWIFPPLLEFRRLYEGGASVAAPADDKEEGVGSMLAGPIAAAPPPPFCFAFFLLPPLALEALSLPSRGEPLPSSKPSTTGAFSFPSPAPAASAPPSFRRGGIFSAYLVGFVGWMHDRSAR